MLRDRQKHLEPLIFKDAESLLWSDLNYLQNAAE